MVNEQKKALKQLHRMLIELIREIEVGNDSIKAPVCISTEDFEFRLEYSKKTKRFLILIKED